MKSTQAFDTNAFTTVADHDYCERVVASRFLLRGERAITFVEINGRADA